MLRSACNVLRMGTETYTKDWQRIVTKAARELPTDNLQARLLDPEVTPEAAAIIRRELANREHAQRGAHR